MWQSMFEVAAAPAVFAAVHSLLASRSAKRAATRIVGERNYNGLYRVPLFQGDCDRGSGICLVETAFLPSSSDGVLPFQDITHSSRAATSMI